MLLQKKKKVNGKRCEAKREGEKITFDTEKVL